MKRLSDVDPFKKFPEGFNFFRTARKFEDSLIITGAWGKIKKIDNGHFEYSNLGKIIILCGFMVSLGSLIIYSISYK